MSVNIYHSRRNKFQRCEYWLRDESDSTNFDEWVLKKTPSGIFYAKETNALARNGFESGGMLFDKDTITLETEDEVSEIKRGCLVLYNGHPWMVTDVQVSIHTKETQFASGLHGTHYINIRR